MIYSQPHIVVNVSATFSCVSGYQLSGAEIITCLDTGAWSDLVPTCAGKKERNRFKIKYT